VDALAAKYNVPGLVASAELDDASLNAAIGRARVVISAAGPYTKCGEPVVKACVQNSTHYVDVTGETKWVVEMVGMIFQFSSEILLIAVAVKVHKYDAGAKAAGILMVHCSGYDSVPVDIGALMLKKDATEGGTAYGTLDAIAAYKLVEGTPDLSHGTLNTVLEGIAAGADSTKDTVCAPTTVPKLQRLPFKKHYSNIVNANVTLFQPPDAPVVRWTHKLENGGQAGDFEYAQYNVSGGGNIIRNIKPLICCIAMSFCCLKFSCCRSCIMGCCHTQRSGPSETDADATRCVITFHGQKQSKEDGVTRVMTCAEAYRFTGQAAVTSALTILQEDKANLPMGSSGGSCSPAAGLGFPLAERLLKKKYITWTEPNPAGAD
jgi:short subunit dehydrogenase-like uncharacterized protein